MASQESPYIGYHSQSLGQPLRKSHRTQASRRENKALHDEEELELDSDDKVECDLSNMEIAEGLAQYFAQTERQKEERSLQQQLDTESLNDNVNEDHSLYFNCHRSVEPPSEKSWEQHQEEMKHLYGNSAPKIVAIEAAIQLSFDKHCEEKQPKYWPVIPLKF